MTLAGTKLQKVKGPPQFPGGWPRGLLTADRCRSATQADLWV